MMLIHFEQMKLVLILKYVDVGVVSDDDDDEYDGGRAHLLQSLWVNEGQLMSMNQIGEVLRLMKMIHSDDDDKDDESEM